MFGLTLFATGFGVSVQGTTQEVVASAVLGTLVGLIAVAAQGRARLALVAPFVASVVVSTLTLVAVKQGWVDGGPIQLMVPCLFFFIPGDAISAGLLELADGRITAGATRLIYSVAILLVLAFGALVATVLADVPAAALFDVDVPDTLGFWAAWGGWVIFAVGTMLTFSMRPADFPWALGLILLTAAAAQLGTKAFDEVLGTFLGAVVMTATELTLARSPRRPPAYVLVPRRVLRPDAGLARAARLRELARPPSDPGLQGAQRHAGADDRARRRHARDRGGDPRPR